MELVGAMKNKYIDLLKVYVTGKRFAQFELAWFCHIEENFVSQTEQTQTTSHQSQVSLHSMWQDVVKSIESKPSLKEQRIIVSMVTYTVYDLMTEKVKEYKINLAELQEESTVAAVTSTSKSNLIGCMKVMLAFTDMVALLYTLY